MPAPDLAARIRRALPEICCSAGAADRISYARDLWPRHHIAVRAGRVAEHAPGAIAWPASTAQVAALVRWCAAQGVSVVPFGAGSGVCAGVLPTAASVVLDTKRLSRWRIDPDRGVVEAEAGAVGIRLEEDLQARGFTVGHFPSSILCSTVGGWIAGRGAGQCSGRYGKIEDMVAAILHVDGRGEAAFLQRRLSGPDLTPLVIGSEGVLGVVTSAALRLHAAPARRRFAAFSFPAMELGWDAIRQMYQQGLRPAVCRLYDPFDSLVARLGAVGSGRRHAGKGLLATGLGAAALRRLLRVPGALAAAVAGLGAAALGGSTLVLVFDEPAGAGGDELARAARIARGNEGRDLGERPARRWFEHRYAISYRQAPIFMLGGFADTMEVAAPWSRLGELYDAVRRTLSRHVFVMAHMSHAFPDGCSIYFTFAGSGADDAACERTYDRAWQDGLDAVRAAGGALSHHHGVGRSKAAHLGDELGAGVAILAALRAAFDPAGILNPGNLTPATPPRRPAGATPPPAEPVLDRGSQLVHAAGDTTLAAVERSLAPSGLSLGLGAGAPDRDATSVATWLAQGAPGAPDAWLDPVDHLVAGFGARLTSGTALEVRPGPRRAVGPDLLSLFLGTRGRVGTIASAHLRARSGPPAAPLPTPIERNPPANAAEQDWIERVLAASAGV